MFVTILQSRRLRCTRPYLIDDGDLHGFDGDGGLVDAQHAGALTGSGAHAAGELGEVVGLQQPVQSLLPASLIHQIVPLRDLVAQGAACTHEMRFSGGNGKNVREKW